MPNSIVINIYCLINLYSEKQEKKREEVTKCICDCNGNEDGYEFMTVKVKFGIMCKKNSTYALSSSHIYLSQGTFLFFSNLLIVSNP